MECEIFIYLIRGLDYKDDELNSIFGYVASSPSTNITNSIVADVRSRANFLKVVQNLFYTYCVGRWCKKMMKNYGASKKSIRSLQTAMDCICVLQEGPNPTKDVRG